MCGGKEIFMPALYVDGKPEEGRVRNIVIGQFNGSVIPISFYRNVNVPFLRDRFLLGTRARCREGA